jgi:hypothetical protein
MLHFIWTYLEPDERQRAVQAFPAWDKSIINCALLQ